jgi:hypothetical protein
MRSSVDTLPPSVVEELDQYSLKAIEKYADTRKGKLALLGANSF